MSNTSVFKMPSGDPSLAAAQIASQTGGTVGQPPTPGLADGRVVDVGELSSIMDSAANAALTEANAEFVSPEPLTNSTDRQVASELVSGLDDGSDLLTAHSNAERLSQEFARRQYEKQLAAEKILNGEAITATSTDTPTTREETVDVKALLKNAGLDVEDSAEEEEAAESEEDALPTDEELLADLDPSVPEAHRKSLVEQRKIIHRLNKELKEKDGKLKTYETEVEKYKKGEEVPEPLKDRIAALEKIEKVHALKSSPYFKEKFVAPLETAKTELLQLANDYQVDPKVLEHAVRLDNKRELNTFLSGYFDELGAVEAKSLVEKTQGLLRGMKEAEKEPQAMIEQLEKDYAVNEAREASLRAERIAATTEGSWMDALNDLRETGRYPELEFRESDDAHNEVVMKVIDTAAKEYAKMVRALAKLGVKELPVEVAKALAKSYQISYAAPIMAISRQQHYEAAKSTMKLMQDRNKYTYPPVGGSAPKLGGTKSSSVPTAADLDAELEATLRKVGL